MIDRERTSFEASTYIRLRDATSREEGSLEENLKRWVLLDLSHNRGRLVPGDAFASEKFKPGG